MEQITTATTIPPKGHGILSESEFKELQRVLGEIHNNLPNHLTDYIWGTYVRIMGRPEPKPCMCKSSGGLWAGAVDTLRKYIQDND